MSNCKVILSSSTIKWFSLVLFDKWLYSLTPIFPSSHLALHFSSFPLANNARFMCVRCIIMKKQYFSISKLVSTDFSYAKRVTMKYYFYICLQERETLDFLSNYSHNIFLLVVKRNWNGDELQEQKSPLRAL